MSTATRTVSETYNSANADIILISSEYVQSLFIRPIITQTDAEYDSNHSYAVHKENLARSPVFRDMFDFAQGQPAARSIDGTEGNAAGSIEASEGDEDRREATGNRDGGIS